MESQEQKPQTTFRLGLTIAGAVSAGAYTAGVLDHLYESLHLWEKLKTDNPDNIPLPSHHVKIDVLAGASAGSLCAALSLLALRDSKTLDKGGEQEKVTLSNGSIGYKTPQSILYKSWVDMNDNQMPDYTDTLDQMLRIKEPNNLTSLLNTDPIEDLSQDIINNHFHEVDDELPDYVSPNAELIMTLTSLRGVRFKLGFGKINNTDGNPSSIPDSGIATETNTNGKEVDGHVMQTHKTVAHYVVNGPERVDRIMLPLLDRDNFSNMMNVAMASGAFPIGLESREIKFQGSYIKSYLLSLYDSVRDAIEIPHLDDKFTTNAVDGGAFNNEPIELVEQKLSDICDTTGDTLREISKAIMEHFPYLKDEVFIRFESKNKDNQSAILVPEQPPTQENCKAHILIDPFPSFEQMEEPDPDASNPEEKDKPSYTGPTSLLDAAGQLLNSFMNQVRVKDEYALRTFREVDGSNKGHRGMIYPSRRDKHGDRQEHSLATGSLGGFGGFLSEDFREYDYGLGRADCKSFLKNHFTIPADTLYQYNSYQNHSSDDLEQLYQDGIIVENKDGDRVLPIIPDLRSPAGIPAYEYDENTFPKIQLSELSKRKSALRLRIHRLFRHLLIIPFGTRAQPNWKFIAMVAIILLGYCGATYLLFQEPDEKKFWLFVGMNIIVPIGVYIYAVFALAGMVYNNIKDDLKDRDQLDEGYRAV